jgi:quercetin dioxygenase-like cupin family protein
MTMRTAVMAVLGIGLVAPLAARSTAPAGVLSNQMLAQGATAQDIDEHVKVGEGWAVRLETRGASDVYFQDLVIAPGGRSGWHSHPGLLVITVQEGAVDWYGASCAKSSYVAGQSFTESSAPHNVVNPGTGKARLLVSYITKKGEPRRAESPQPACAGPLGLP